MIKKLKNNYQEVKNNCKNIIVKNSCKNIKKQLQKTENHFILYI